MDQNKEKQLLLQSGKCISFPNPERHKEPSARRSSFMNGVLLGINMPPYFTGGSIMTHVRLNVCKCKMLVEIKAELRVVHVSLVLADKADSCSSR